MVSNSQDLDKKIDKMIEVIENCRQLSAKADVDADRKNRLILRQRAIADLDNIRESNKLVELRESCKNLVEIKKAN